MFSLAMSRNLELAAEHQTWPMSLTELNIKLSGADNECHERDSGDELRELHRDELQAVLDSGHLDDSRPEEIRVEDSGRSSRRAELPGAYLGHTTFLSLPCCSQAKISLPAQLLRPASL